jgi:DNA-directed RNA polymerase subunit RPC12/RpoP
MNKPDYYRRDYFDEQQYESLVQAGIAAVKGGDKEQGIHLLSKASQMKPEDARPWLWLSATTDNLQEQRNYLEYALAADPNNSAARQGLVHLSGKLDKSRLMKEGEGIEAKHPGEPEKAKSGQIFSCPNCGGQMSFNLDQQLVCEFCGHSEEIKANYIADEAEQVLDFVLPTTRGHSWSEAQQHLVCSRCGAMSLFAEGVTAAECPYCGSHQMVTSEEITELIDPQVIAPAKLADKGMAGGRLVCSG